jgi:hypothetical protein
MSQETKPIQPLISREMMEKIVSSRRSITSEKFYEEVANHTGKPTRSARKAVYRNGRKIWVSV